ncbi:hypothetical protein ACFY0F_30100 [Streptomyces sp. NPDC001544]|uniref:hypothetical protein n=1 Tax=Streptomyces sp. NPDC001544 TaxID=3364584 RepID=UPI0036758572
MGSDTTQDVVNALAGDTVNGRSYSSTAVKAASGAGIAFYDAIEPGTGPPRRTSPPAPAARPSCARTAPARAAWP